MLKSAAFYSVIFGCIGFNHYTIVSPVFTPNLLLYLKLNLDFMNIIVCIILFKACVPTCAHIRIHVWFYLYVLSIRL